MIMAGSPYPPRIKVQGRLSSDQGLALLDLLAQDFQRQPFFFRRRQLGLCRGKRPGRPGKAFPVTPVERRVVETRLQPADIGLQIGNLRRQGFERVLLMEAELAFGGPITRRRRRGLG